MMTTARRRTAGVITATLTLLLGLAVPPASAETATLERLEGADRYGTAAAISRERFAPGVATVYVANGLQFPDALAGAPLAARDGAPVLLVTPTGIPSSVRTELQRLAPGRIVIIGSTGVVSDDVATALAAYTSGGVTRLAGEDRYATSAAISESYAPGGDVYVAGGLDFPDALAGAAAAGAGDAPLLLVRGSEPDTVVSRALERLRPERIVILGSFSVVSPELEAALTAYAGTVTRLAGKDRYATAAAVSAATHPDGADTAYLATGADFPDALAGAAVAGQGGAPLVLVRELGIDTPVSAEIARLTLSRVVVLGSTGVISEAVAKEASGQATDPILEDKPVVTPPPSWDEIAGIDATYTTPAASRGAGKIALDWAKTQLGKPYGWGEEGPDSYDCSGLTMRAYERAGIPLRRVTRDQWYDTTRVALDDMVPGDLMFWSNNGQPSGIYHVAIYVGNGMRLHAPSPGKFVELVPVWSGNLLPYGGRIG